MIMKVLILLNTAHLVKMEASDVQTSTLTGNPVGKMEVLDVQVTSILTKNQVVKTDISHLKATRIDLIQLNQVLNLITIDQVQD
jgi:hypothetical protein